MTIIWIFIFILPPVWRKKSSELRVCLLLPYIPSSFTAGVSAVTTVTGHRGHSAQIRCPYESGYETYMKYLCRGACSSGKKDIPVQSGSTAEDQRFSLDDNKAARVFTITITDLRPEDKGTYWCGIKTSYPLPDIYTEVLLLVKLGPFRDGVPFHSTPSLSGSTYVDSRNIIIMVLGVLLVVVGIGFGLIGRCKWRKSTGTLAVLTCRIKNTAMNPDAADYENDVQGNQHSMAMGSVYQSLNPNTDQSDAVYQSLNPNTNQSDSVYQSLNPNTNQSDSVYQSLHPIKNQSDAIYQSLDPNTNQSDSVYQSLNPNTNQSDSVYQSLNPNTNQSDSVYQSLNPNTNHSDSVY
ncbi:hypothetical protein NFI96_023554 [Prochilodus magdalenae]|nr:hypothetical protein NFI96_023554 [Prochilodus magdalenae]